ncbi:MAG: DUF5110 domain-containing protein [Bacteroidales bacterium]|nr:DUF5110 domain-containing protein [Bacteroidales bacterium]
MNLQDASDTLGIMVVPGNGKSSFRLYEDDGVSRDFESACAFTRIEKNRSGRKLELVIHPREGSYQGAPARRTCYVVLEGVTDLPRSVTLNGKTTGECTVSEGSVSIRFSEPLAADSFNRININL